MIRWITEQLGTGPYEKVRRVPAVRIIGVCDFVDKAGNSVSAIQEKIEQAAHLLQRGERIVVCCDYGISRSNAVAAGVLAVTSGMPFSEAVHRVISATGEKSIKIAVLNTVREAVAEIQNLPELAETGKRKILVTGGSGFLGSTLVPRLQRGFNIMRPNRQEIDLREDAVKLDIMVKNEGVTEILHLANPRIINTNKAFGEAITILKNVLDICQNNRLKLIYSSCFEVYAGYNESCVKASEMLSPLPMGLVGELKYISEKLIECVCEQYGLEYAIIRSSTVYGGDGSKPKFLYNFIQKARQGEEIVTHKYLDGYPKLDMLHIDDFCNAVQRILHKNTTGSYNIGSGKSVSTTEIARLIIEIIKSKSIISHNEISYSYSNIIIDTKKANEELKWWPQIDIFEGLKKLIN